MRQLSNYKYRSKAQKVTVKAIDNLAGLLRILEAPKYTLPDSVSDALASGIDLNGTMYYIPQDNASFDVEGVCVTGPMQLKWIGQLIDMPLQFVLHADGKHKLHHAGWILITLGTHHLRRLCQDARISCI